MEKRNYTEEFNIGVVELSLNLDLNIKEID